MPGPSTAISIRNISKRYRIGAKEELSDSALMAVLNFAKSPMRNFRKYRSLYKFRDEIDPATGEVLDRGDRDVIWALKNVSAEIESGELVAIIGRNGAGKSTLLKILSKIISPSFGRAEIRGRVSSLLEVGTGFHPDLTGRENIYMNGTILGMKKKEIDGKFDQIVDFSGIGPFLDTPVKRYSSGMSVRLAFSVAAHLEPEILIVDEVLAVGDLDFQKKCLNKMESVGREGRTVLFVSHNLPAVTRLCNRAILLENGRITLDGPCGAVVGQYMTRGKNSTAEVVWDDPRTAPGKKIARLRAVRILDQDGKVADVIDIRREFIVEMEYDVLKSGSKLLPHYSFVNSEGTIIFVTIDHDPEWKHRLHAEGRYVSRAWVPGNFLADGALYVNASMITLNPAITEFHEPSAVSCMIVDSREGDSARGEYTGVMPGVIRPILKWKTTAMPGGPAA
jgi:lipopolysaccharide transport system ATP-binding protein